MRCPARHRCVARNPSAENQMLFATGNPDCAGSEWLILSCNSHRQRRVVLQPRGQPRGKLFVHVLHHQHGGGQVRRQLRQNLGQGLWATGGGADGHHGDSRSIGGLRNATRSGMSRPLGELRRRQSCHGA